MKTLDETAKTSPWTLSDDIPIDQKRAAKLYMYLNFGGPRNQIQVPTIIKSDKKPITNSILNTKKDNYIHVHV